MAVLSRRNPKLIYPLPLVPLQRLLDVNLVHFLAAQCSLCAQILVTLLTVHTAKKQLAFNVWWETAKTMTGAIVLRNTVQGGMCSFN